MSSNNKSFDPAVEQQSVVEAPKVTEHQSPHVNPIILTVAAASQAISPWGVRPKIRDQELRAFWHTEPWLASVVYSVSIRNASFVWDIVGADPSRPNPKNTVAAVKRILHNSNRGKGWKDLLIKTCVDLYCLAGHTRISLGGERRGQTKTIAQIVRDKDTGPVLSVDQNGVLVERQITEWHTSPLGQRKWYWLSTKQATSHSRYDKKQGGIFLTEDHPMLTDRGWVQARDILSTDRIATSDPLPSEEQAEVLVGGLLGDMGMSRFTKRAIIRFSHSEKQADYLEFKKSILRGFSWTGQNIYTKKDASDKYHTTIGVNSCASLGLSAWYDRWYINKKKRVNREDFIRYFSPRMLAVWFMDDGSRGRTITTAENVSENGILSTNGFPKEDVEWLIEELNKRGFTCVLQPVKKYYTIRFTAAGFRQVTQYIGKYIIPSLRYKLGQDAPEYDPSVWAIDPATIYFDEVDSIEQKDYIGSGKVVQTTYHIGVEETRNFVAGRLISHNTQDNGAFWEIIRSEDRPNAPVINIAHLDSGQCQRTGDPEYPVIYTDRYGKERVLRWWQVRSIEELPSPIEKAFGLQYSAVSRCLLAAEIIQSIAVYKQEKVGGTFSRAIDIVSGVTHQNIEDAVTVSEEQRLNRQLYRYSVPVIIPGVDPTSALSHVHIDLAALPDNFDEDSSLRWYVAQLAAAFGVDYQEIAPLMSGNLGSSQQSEIMHLKTRGKGPALIMGLIEDIINNGLIPGNVVFRFLEQDVRSEAEKADARFTRAKDRAMRVKAGELDGQAARWIAVKDGDLPEWLALEIDAREKARLAAEEPEEESEGSEFGPEQILGGITAQEEQ